MSPWVSPPLDGTTGKDSTMRTFVVGLALLIVTFGCFAPLYAGSQEQAMVDPETWLYDGGDIGGQTDELKLQTAPSSTNLPTLDPTATFGLETAYQGLGLVETMPAGGDLSPTGTGPHMFRGFLLGGSMEYRVATVCVGDESKPGFLRIEDSRYRLVGLKYDTIAGTSTASSDAQVVASFQAYLVPQDKQVTTYQDPLAAAGQYAVQAVASIRGRVIRRPGNESSTALDGSGAFTAKGTYGPGRRASLVLDATVSGGDQAGRLLALPLPPMFRHRDGAVTKK